MGDSATLCRASQTKRAACCQASGSSTKAPKAGGLGVKKLVTKVDESVFDQKPEEPPAIVPQASSACQPCALPWKSPSLCYTLHSTSVRSYDGHAKDCQVVVERLLSGCKQGMCQGWLQSMLAHTWMPSYAGIPLDGPLEGHSLWIFS